MFLLFSCGLVLVKFIVFFEKMGVGWLDMYVLYLFFVGVECMLVFVCVLLVWYFVGFGEKVVCVLFFGCILFVCFLDGLVCL